MNTQDRTYVNGVIFENGQPVGFYDTGDTLGMMSEEEEDQTRAKIADLAERRRKLEERGQWNLGQ